MTSKTETDYNADDTSLIHNENDNLLDTCTLPAAFRKTSYQVAKDTIRYVCRHGREPEPASCRAATLMRNLVTDTLKERCDKMNELATKLNIRRPEQLSAINDIAVNMFDDQVISWGRIVTLYSFCSYLAWFCEQHNISSDCSDEVAQRLGDFVVNRLGLWIVTHGGWEAFEKQFPTFCFWDVGGLWKGIIIFSILIGTVIAFYNMIYSGRY